MDLWRKLSATLVLLIAVIALSGCDDTWRGLKEDTGENLERTGEALDRAGERIQGEEEPQ